MNEEYVITEEMKKVIEENFNLLSEYCQNEQIPKEYRKMIDEISNGKREFNRHEYLFLNACFELVCAIRAYEYAMFRIAESEKQKIPNHKLN